MNYNNTSTIQYTQIEKSHMGIKYFIIRSGDAGWRYNIPSMGLTSIQTYDSIAQASAQAVAMITAQEQ